MKKFVFTVAMLVCGNCFGGVVVSQPANVNDYLAVQFVPSEDNPVIKANGLVTTNGNVWVEKSDPVFETEFVGYDYPFTTHNLSGFTTGGVVEVGFGNAYREVNYFNNGWDFYPWYQTSQLSVPEPSTIMLGSIGLLFMFRRSRNSL